MVQAIFYSDDVLPPSSDSSTEDYDDLPGYSPSVDEDDMANSNDFASLSVSGLSTRNTSSHPSSSVRRKPRTFADDQQKPAIPSHHAERSPSTSDADHPTPFVSFTATLEGCSLTADIRLLRKLFPNDQENNVFAAGEGGLDSPWIGEQGDDDLLLSEDEMDQVETEDNLRSRGRSRKRDSALSQVSRFDQRSINGYPTTNGVDGSRRLLKCLQLDLSSFGLGRSLGSGST